MELVMTKSLRPSNRRRKSKGEELFIRAEKQEKRGELRSAFRLYLAGAKLGETGCQVDVGNYYDDGKAVRRNRKAALYWYKRAYRRGSASAAHNIGILLRNDKNPKHALEWFKKAVRMGDGESNLEIAKHYLRHEQNAARAVRHLKKVLESNWVSEAGQEEATRLLKHAEKQISSLSY